MKFIRENIIFRFLWFTMALHILNCSVDTPDAGPQNIPEDLSYNDMESIVEIILEQIIGVENAIAEMDDTDTDESGAFTIKKGLDFSNYPSSLKSLIFCNSHITPRHSLYKEKYSEQFHPELVPPPPKA